MRWDAVGEKLRITSVSAPNDFKIRVFCEFWRTFCEKRCDYDSVRESECSVRMAEREGERRRRREEEERGGEGDDEEEEEAGVEEGRGGTEQGGRRGPSSSVGDGEGGEHGDIRQWEARQQCPGSQLHKKGRCSECGGCRKCPSPPWCRGAEHVGSGVKRSSSRSSKKRPYRSREAKRSAKRRIVECVTGGTSADLAVRQAERQEESEAMEASSDLTPKDVFEMLGVRCEILQAVSSDTLERSARARREWAKVTRSCVDKLLSVFVDGDERLLRECVARLSAQDESLILNDASQRESDRVMECVFNVVKNGCPHVRRCCMSILAEAVPYARLKENLRSRGYCEQRRMTAAENKQRAARKRRTTEPDDADDELQTVRSNFTLADHTYCGLRLLYKNTLLKGKEPQRQQRGTRISANTMLTCVTWISDTLHFRPGSVRNVRLNGQLMKGMPVFVCPQSLDSLENQYRKDMQKQLEKPMGTKSFRQVVHALSVNGRENAGLSYFYVDHIDLIALLRQMYERVKELFSQTLPADVAAALAAARADTDHATEFLRHQYRRSLKEDSEDGCKCARYAVGGECNHDHQFYADSPLLRVRTAHLSVKRLADTLLTELEAQIDDDEELKLEVQSMKRMAEITRQELCHYSSHLVRGWWQENELRKIREGLVDARNRVMIVIDHKQKVLPKRQNEKQSDYYAKRGMSLLGGMVLRAVDEDESTVICASFIDVVMNNTWSQTNTDVKPGVEAILEEVHKQLPDVTIKSARRTDASPIHMRRQQDTTAPTVEELQSRRVQTMATSLQTAVAAAMIGTVHMATTDDVEAAPDSAAPAEQILGKHWAQKKNKTWTSLDRDIVEELTRIFDAGYGKDNMQNRHSAETAADEMKNGLLLRVWDQRFVASVAKVKTLFSQLTRQRRSAAQVPLAHSGGAGAALEEEPVDAETAEEQEQVDYEATYLEEYESLTCGEELLAEDIENLDDTGNYDCIA